MNAAKTTIATAVATSNTTVASIIDVVRGETYVYQGKEVVAIKVLKKSGKVVIEGKDMNQVKVNVNELTNVELTVEEIAMQTAVKAFKAAQAGLTKADKALREISKKAAVVGTPEYRKAVEARDAALVAIREADDNLVAVKYKDRSFGRFNIKTKDVDLNLDEIDAFYKDAMENYTDVDKEAGRQLSHIYGFIAIVNIIKVARALTQIDPESEYTKAYYAAMRDLRIKQTNDLESSFVTIWHLVFGGNNKRGPVNALTHVVDGKYETSPIRNAWDKYVAKAGETSSLVTLDDRAISIKPMANVGAARIGLRDAVRKLEYVNQVVFVRVTKGPQAQIARSLTALQKLIGMHSSGIALEGLRNNKLFSSVVEVGFANSTWKSANVVLDPMAVLKENSDDYTAEQIVIANTLRSNGYSVAANPENYGKHGYIQLTSTYNRKENNAFINEDGSSYEDMSKLIVRLMKQSWNPGEVQFEDMRTIVIGLITENLPAEVDAEAQAKFNEVVSDTFVAGPTLASKKAFGFMGTGRFVTGSEADASGQKTVVCAPEKTMVRELSHVYFNIGGGHDEQFVIAGLNSTKSAKFKYTAGWKLEIFEVEGKKVALYVKETKETYKLTFSATANAFRAVDEKLVGVEAAMNSLARATNALQSETATKLIYEKNGKTLAENIEALLASGRIARKSMHVATNSQFNQGLEFQHGVNVAKEVLTSLVRSNIASSFRNDVVNSLLLAEGSVAESDIGEVSAQRIVKTIANGCAQLGLPLEDVKGKVMHIQIVKSVMKMFAKTNKKWVRIRFDDTRAVLFPITQDLLESFEGTQRPLYVALQGIAAELFEAFAYFVQTAKPVDEEAEVTTYNVELTDSGIDIAMGKLNKARDAVAGKPLNKVPTIGATLLLATSAHLRNNEVYSSTLNALGLHARASYRQAVTCLYFKSPLLWKGSISAARLVDQVSSKDAEWLAEFGGDEEYNNIMQGTCSYISSAKAVKNGNDADGDLNSFVFVPTRTLDGTALANSKHFIDATDVKVAAGAHHYATKWEDELAGLILNTNKRIELKSTEGFEKAFEQAVVRAAREKANVAIFTSHQTATLNYRGAYMEAFKGALERVANHIEFEDFADWAEDLLADDFAMNVAAEALWSFNADVQGSCVNFDAMDQVKSAEGRNIKKLASLLSAGELKFINYSYMRSIASEDKKASTIRMEVNKGIEQRSLEIYNTMFNPRQHNIAIEQLHHVLPAYTEDEAAVVKKMVAYMMVVCGSNVGYFAASKYDVCQAIAATAQKVNGRAVAANLETLASVQSEKGREKVEIKCVQRTIAEAAVEFNNKVLF